MLEACEPGARYLEAVQPASVRQFELLATAPGGVPRIRELILCLATTGQLLANEADPSHWHPLTLDQVGEWGSGGTPLKSHPEYYDGGTIPWLVIGDLNDGVVTSAATCISDIGLRNSSAKVVEPGTVLIAMYGSIGKLGIAGFRCATNQAIAFCRPSANVVTGHYLFLFLRSIRASLLQRGQGLAQQNISQKILRSVEISVPPLAEQARIVARVDELMRLCDALEAKGQLEAEQHARLLGTLLGTLTNSSTPEELAANWQRVADHFDLLLDRPEAVDALEQTILQLAVRGLLVPQDPSDEPATALLDQARIAGNCLDAKPASMRGLPAGEPQVDQEFRTPSGWEWVSLADLLPEFQNGVASRGDTGGRQITVLRLADIKARRVSLADTRQIPIAERDIEKYRLRSGDILITRVNGSADIVGQFNLCEEEVDAIYCDHFIRLRVRTDWLDPAFTAILGESDLIRNRIRGLFITTAGQKTVNQGHIGSLRFALPPWAEQIRIVTRVTQLRCLCAELRQRLTSSQTTQSRLAEALIAEVA